MKVPWIRPLGKEFKPDHRGNTSEHHHRYTDSTWRKETVKFFRGHPCQRVGCMRQATCTDHIIRVNDGGSMWDRRNWQRLCTTCHNRKSGREAQGQILPFVETPNGRIPAERAGMEPDIVRVKTKR